MLWTASLAVFARAIVFLPGEKYILLSWCHIWSCVDYIREHNFFNVLLYGEWQSSDKMDKDRVNLAEGVA